MILKKKNWYFGESVWSTKLSMVTMDLHQEYVTTLVKNLEPTLLPDTIFIPPWLYMLVYIILLSKCLLNFIPFWFIYHQFTY